LATQISLKHRTFQDEDLQAIYDLIGSCEEADKLDQGITLSELHTNVYAPDVDRQRDMRLWEDEQGKLIAFGTVNISEESTERPDTDGRFNFWVMPDARNQGLETEMIEWAAERLAEAGRERGQPVTLYGGSRDFDAYRCGILEKHGFEVVRYFFRMARDLHQPIPEPRFPEGFTLTHTTGIEESRRWTDMFNLSFIDHWNHHPLSYEVAEHYMKAPTYVPERDLIAVAADGTFAAFCYCEVNEEDNQRNNRKDGWIHLLGTRRGYRNIGLGRAMLLAGLLRLKSDGMDRAMLGVDAENLTGALGLYERAGFEKVTTNVVYSKVL
jgi:mycothiol synthase